MPLSPGDKIGPYEILGPLGKGGMGEVYRGRDTKLDREVAIKVLPAPFANDPERLARFEREAKVLAALNHPNIAQIYGLEQSDGTRALVMELVPGAMLNGPLPLDDVLRIARQIANALQAAHDKHIVHRDLKPANIMVTPDGNVKVLDFGLAKLAEKTPTSTGDPSQSPTLTMRATEVGMILGTAAYMSPEQARGQDVDRRTDIWAFGVVLWELLTGKPLFHGATVSDILASVLKEEPDFDSVPAKMRPLLRRCLDKEPGNRLQAIGDWDLLITNGVEPAARSTATTSSSLFAWGTAAVCLLAAAGLALVHFREEAPQLLKLSVPLPESATLYTQSGIPSISPDGRRMAFVATRDGKAQLWVRDLNSTSARAIAGTEGARYPFWSPDSKAIGFSLDSKLKTVSLAGGELLTVCDPFQFRGGSWSPRGVILFGVTNGGIFQVQAAGGTPKPVTTLEASANEGGHRFPWFLPDGHHFLFNGVIASRAETGGIYVFDLDTPGGDRRLLVRANSNAIYTPGGYLLFVREGTLMAQPLDTGKLQTTGEAAPIADGVDRGSVQTEFEFSASQTGVLAYTSGRNTGKEQLTWMDRSGKPVGKVGQPQDIRWASVSPDGKTVAADQLDPATGYSDIWLHDLNRGTASRFTFGPRTNAWPVWSPDGNRLGYFGSRPETTIPHTFVKALSGTEQETTLDNPLGNQESVRVDDWSRDGRYIIEETNPGLTGPNDLWVLPLTDGKLRDHKSYPYLHSAFAEMFAKLSPDGRWLAYQGNESGRAEVFVQSFPEPGGKWQVSTASGGHPIWSRDGKELYFLSSNLKIMAVDVKSEPGKFQAGLPKALFDVRMRNDPNTWFDVSPDGRFLIPMLESESASVPISVVINWQAGLKK